MSARDLTLTSIGLPVRLLLHEVSMSPPSLRQESNGDWFGVGANGWLIQSPANAEFRSLSAARSAMLEWARAHSAHSAILGGRRCIALSEDGVESYRLWQCVSTSAHLIPCPVPAHPSVDVATAL